MRTCFKIIALFILIVMALMPSAKGASFFNGYRMDIHKENSSVSALSEKAVLPENGNAWEDNSFFYFSDGLISNGQINPEVYSASFRFRKGSETIYSFRLIMHQLSNREYRQVQNKGEFFYSHINHHVRPVCQYYVFTLRQILI